MTGLFAAFLTHEVRTQARSLKFRVLAGTYVAVTVAPALLLFVNRAAIARVVGAGTFGGFIVAMQPLPTAILAALLSVDGIFRERQDRSLAVVGLAPITSAGYILRRWAAIVTILLPLTLVPPLAGALLATLAGAAPAAAGPVVGPWLLQVVPILVTVSALAFGLGSIADGSVLAGLLAFLLAALILGGGNTLLEKRHRKLEGPGSFLFTEGAGNIVGEVVYRAKGASLKHLTMATDAPYDARAAAETYLPAGALLAGLASLALGLSAAFLRRTRPDLRPISVRSDHPLRTLVSSLNRLREEFMPDPGLALADWSLIGLSVATCVALLSWLGLRDGHFLALAEARYRVETSGQPEPMAKRMVPAGWRIAGELFADGRIRVHVAGALVNEGTEPVSHLAFSLNPFLTVRNVTTGRTQRIRREWDRLTVDLDEAVPKGGVVSLEADLEGAPATVRFPYGEGGWFATSHASWRQAQLSLDLVDFSRSSMLRAVSGRRVVLEGADLTPVPRYEPWTLTPPSRVKGVPGQLVPTESHFPDAALALDLRVPESIFLVDTCGHSTRNGRLEGGCPIPLSELRVLGGAFQRVPDPPGLGAMAVLPAHAAHARRHFPALAAASELARRAWPGLDPLAESVLLEWPVAFDVNPWQGMWPWLTEYRPAVVSSGRVLLLSESFLTLKQPFAPEWLASDAVAAALLRRRPVLASEQTFFRQLLRTVASARLGKGRATRAVQGRHETVHDALLGDHGYYSSRAYGIRLPAVLADVENRTGARAFQEGIEAFLAARGGGAGSAKELFQSISDRSGVPLDRMYRDYLAGDALPILALADVSFRKEGRRHVVTGFVTNIGTGESLCPVVLRTGLEPVSTVVRVDSGQKVPFKLATEAIPRVVNLDPDQVAYRQAPLGLTLRVLYEEP